ncbi:MAG: hypothetical protein HY784_14120 [Chloroflexi bacterium]|nr:hypothetical protein [Chloroflexota bacterium]
MIKTPDELAVSQERLSELRARFEEIANSQNKNPRIKEVELAGVRGMIEQIDAEITSYLLTEIHQTIDSLRVRVRETDTLNLPQALDETLGVLDSVTDLMRVSGPASRPQLASLPVAE